MLTLHDDIHAAAIGTDLVLLDVGDDSYQVLHGAVRTDLLGVSIAGIGATVHPEAVCSLRDAGMVVPTSAALHRPQPLAAPSGSLPPPDRPVLTSTAVLLFLCAMIVAWWRARGRGTCRCFRRERAHARPDVGDDVLSRSMAELRAVRLLVPSPRRCLPASLLVAAYLDLRGIDCEIVFGVRGSPFGAHCWVERGGVAVDDDIDRISAFQPIAVGYP